VKDVTVEVSPRLEPGQPITVVPARYKRTRSTGFNLRAPFHLTNGSTTPTRRKADSLPKRKNLHHMDVAVIGHDLADGTVSRGRSAG
jgi:hypothetical protein